MNCYPGCTDPTLGAALLESRIKKSPPAFSDQTKLVIKEKIDELESLEEKDFKFSFLH